LAAIADRGEAILGDAQRAWLARIAHGQARRAHPDQTLADLHLHAGEGVQVLLVAAPGDEGQSIAPE